MQCHAIQYDTMQSSVNLSLLCSQYTMQCKAMQFNTIHCNQMQYDVMQASINPSILCLQFDARDGAISSPLLTLIFVILVQQLFLILTWNFEKEGNYCSLVGLVINDHKSRKSHCQSIRLSGRNQMRLIGPSYIFIKQINVLVSQKWSLLNEANLPI